MKKFWSREEIDNHLVLLTFQANVKKLIERGVASGEETRYLKCVDTYLDKFNEAVFKRLGSAYTRKLLRTVEINEVAIVAKGTERKEALSFIAGEDFLPCFKDLQAVRCMGCKREDYKNCSIFNMGTTVGGMGKDVEVGCPFMINEFDDFE